MRSNSFDGLMRAAAIVSLTAAMSLRVAAAENSQAESARIADWRAKRLASLTSETGWLTPIALYWLKDGENSFGRASDRAFSVDDAALAADTGAFVLRGGHARYVAHASKAMTYLGKPVASLDLIPDIDEHPTELIAGSLHFMLIERAGHLGIRVRDSVSPNRVQFKGLQYFPVRADWHIPAHFEPYVPARHIQILNILGMTEEMISPGAIVFERAGRAWRLDAILEAPGDRELFVMFSDATPAAFCTSDCPTRMVSRLTSTKPSIRRAPSRISRPARSRRSRTSSHWPSMRASSSTSARVSCLAGRRRATAGWAAWA